MNYTLLGSVRSPFVRICRIFMIKNNIAFNFKTVDFVNSSEDAKFVSEKTPINRVPVLFLNEEKIFDSRIILNELIKKHNLKPLSIEEENLISVVYSCLDAGVTLFLMRRDGFNFEKDSFFLNRTKKRIPDGLSYLEPWFKALDAGNPVNWSLPVISLYSFLYWANKRELLSLEENSECRQFLERFKDSVGVKETAFD